MISRRTIFLCYGGLTVAALLVRLIMVFFANYGEIKTVRPDTASYLEPAKSMARDGVYNSTRRPPGFPVLAAAVFKCGGGERALSCTLAMISVLTVLAVARAGYLCGGHKTALIAGGLYAFNPTVLGNVPLLLSDSWAGLFVALQYWFFMEFYRSRKWQWFCICSAVAAWGALIRPVNLLFIIPLLFLLAVLPDLSWQKKLRNGIAAILVFSAIVFPWMYRNSVRGAGFTIDTNTGAMYHQNGAMLLGEVNGRGYEFEKQRILTEQQELFKDRDRFPDEASRERYRIGEYRKLVRIHWLIWLKQQCNYQILLPDVPSFMECLGVTSSDRGTMAIIKEQGIMAGVRHYFGEKWFNIMLTLLPLLGVAAVTYLGCGIKLVQDLCNFKTNYMEIFLFITFVFYYLFLPGAITAPRYQIPALPFMCVGAAAVIIEVIGKIHHRGKHVESGVGDIPEKTAD